MNYSTIEKKIYAAGDNQADSAVRRVAVAGQAMLFDKKTHGALFKEITGDGEQLGKSVANIMLVLYGQSKNTMPRGALLPAGAIIMAKAAEFLEKSGDAPMSDEIFDTALQRMVVDINDKFDPKFRDKVSQMSGKKPAQQVQSEQPQPAAQPAAQPAPRGLINAGG